MADITFIVSNKRSNSDVENSVVGSKYFTDCTLEVGHQFTNAVTEHAVESGVSFSDHVQNKNKRFTVRGVFSEIPVDVYAGDQLPLEQRVKGAYSFLTGLYSNRSTFTLVSKHDVYDNCVLEGLNIPTTSESDFSLFFDMNIVQIRTAKTESVNIVEAANVKDFKQDDVSKTTNLGKRTRLFAPATNPLSFVPDSYNFTIDPAPTNP